MIFLDLSNLLHFIRELMTNLDTFRLEVRPACVSGVCGNRKTSFRGMKTNLYRETKKVKITDNTNGQYY